MTTAHGVRPSALKNMQNKKDMRRRKSHIRKCPRCENRKKHPKARLGSTEEFWGAKEMPNTFHPILLMNMG